MTHFLTFEKKCREQKLGLSTPLPHLLLNLNLLSLKAKMYWNACYDSEFMQDYRRDKKNKKKSRDRSSRSKDESDDEYEIKEDQERPSAEDEKLSLEDVNAICLKRTYLEQKCEEHYFDKMVEGFFVRVGMTSTSDRRVYLLTQVVQVKELPKKYTLGSKKTNKYLVLGIGTSTKQFSMDVVSNSPVDEVRGKSFF